MSTAAFLPPATSGGPVQARVARLRRDAGELAEILDPESLAALPDAAAAQVAADLAAVSETTKAGSWAAVARVADCGYPQAQGYVTAGVWWQRTTRVSKDEAATQVRLARRLARHYEATWTAWSTGRICGEHARVIAGGIDAVLARHARRIRREHAVAGLPLDPQQLTDTLAGLRAELEATLLGLAGDWGPETLRIALSHARIIADPDGASEEQMKRALNPKLTIEDVGELAVVSAQVSLEVAAKLRVILDHHRTLAHHRGTAAGDGDRPVETDPVTGDPVVVPNAQKDAEALCSWVDATLDGGLGSKPVTERPHLDVVVTLADLQNGTGAAFLARTDTPVPVTTAQRIACDAHVRVVIVDGVYRDPRTGDLLDPVIGALLHGAAGLLDYGRAHRIVPTRLRRALAHRDRGCAFPGCGRPPAHTEAHHILPWEHDGKTSLANTVLLCARHHHYVHEGRWRITLRPGMRANQPGCWQFAPPHRQAQL
jgi:hypothetical protein